MSEDYPLPGQLWKHYNGITYRVLFIANEQSKNPNYQPTVVYETANRSSAEAAKWSLPLHDWNRSMTRIKEETAIHYISTHHQLMDENDRLLAEIARLRGRVEVLERVRAAAQALIDFDDRNPTLTRIWWKGEPLRAALKDTAP